MEILTTSSKPTSLLGRVKATLARYQTSVYETRYQGFGYGYLINGKWHPLYSRLKIAHHAIWWELIHPYWGPIRTKLYESSYLASDSLLLHLGYLKGYKWSYHDRQDWAHPLKAIALELTQKGWSSHARTQLVVEGNPFKVNVFSLPSLVIRTWLARKRDPKTVVSYRGFTTITSFTHEGKHHAELIGFPRLLWWDGVSQKELIEKFQLTVDENFSTLKAIQDGHD